MTTAVQTSSEPAVAGVPPDDLAPPVIWGHTPLGMHDRFWAGRRVAVVRPGDGLLSSDGPRLYLLIPDDLGVTFEFGNIARQFAWMMTKAARLRIVEKTSGEYAERVVAHGDRFGSIRRDYRARTRSTVQAWLTCDRRLAGRWAEAPDAREAHAMMKRATKKEGRLVVRAVGNVIDFRTAAPEHVMNLLLRAWRRPGETFKGLYEYDAGVWVHESSRIDPTARLVGPVWVGAGVDVPRDAVVVGPAILPDSRSRRVRVAPLSWEEMAMPRWQLIPRGIASLRRPSKRIFDIVFALLAIAFTLPLYPFIIAAIVLEDGWPVFFAHRRQTIRGREFPCLKFRTMCRDAERMKPALAAANACDGPQFFMPEDPRLLRVGRFLRRYQLDELPQFWNVLFGHMSVVGPRPSPDGENQFCPAWREARLSVRPGVTGLWQIRRTREPLTDFQEWIRYDLEYVMHQSLRLDLWVIRQTVLTVLFGRHGE